MISWKDKIVFAIKNSPGCIGVLVVHPFICHSELDSESINATHNTLLWIDPESSSG